MTRIAYYEATILDFLAADEDAILGALTLQHGFALEHQQKHAWQGQIQFLRHSLPPTMAGWIYFEFSIPRMGKRVDVVIVTGGVLFVVEFKVGACSFDRSSYYLEETASEFDIQGLELDWTCVCWDADLRYDNNRWGSVRIFVCKA